MVLIFLPTMSSQTTGNFTLGYHIFLRFVAEISKWGDQTEQLLKEMYANLEQSKHPIKSKWQVIAKKMKQLYGYNFTSEQCRCKIKCMKEKHERKKKKENQTGESPDEGSDHEDLFDKMPDVKPKICIDSLKKAKRPKNKPEDSQSDTEESSQSAKGTTPGNILLSIILHFVYRQYCRTHCFLTPLSTQPL